MAVRSQCLSLKTCHLQIVATGWRFIPKRITYESERGFEEQIDGLWHIARQDERHVVERLGLRLRRLRHTWLQNFIR